MLKKIFKNFIKMYIITLIIGSVVGIIASLVLGEILMVFSMILTTIIFVAILRLMNKKTSETVNKAPKIIKGNMKHMKGLPIAKGVSCEVTLIDNSYKFVANNAEFILDKSKVLDLTLKTDVKVRRGYKTSVGGAAIGSMIGGVRGATILGVKPKENRSYTYSLMITYNKNNKVSYIVLEEGAFSFFSNQLIKEFRKNAMPNNSIASFDL